MTTTLYKIIKSELINNGYDEFVDENGDLIFFDNNKQFTRKILLFDNDVQRVVNDLMIGIELENPGHDMHFKKTFVYRFLNRKINRQTVDAFQYELLATFLSKQDYINAIYEDVEKFILQENSSNQTSNQNNEQETNSNNLNDSRSAYANLPQSEVNLDVDNTTISTADDNTVSRNKQVSQQTSNNKTNGETLNKSNQYKLDELIKSSNLLSNILDEFDLKCFMQIF